MQEPSKFYALSLLLNEYHGVLSTQSLDMPGFPFGSVAPYSLDSNGNVIVLISSIAQHTKNIIADNKVSFIITARGIDNIQTAARLTLMAEAEEVPLEDKDTAERYYRYFPASRNYHKTHNFNFYRLHTVRARYIGGFGKIHWIEPEQLQLPYPFSGTEEEPMLDHMNSDHNKAIEKYCQDFGFLCPPEEQPKMVGIDCLGAHIKTGERINRVTFSQQAQDSRAVRQELVALARR